jgi:hypothetical protein
VDFIGEMHSSHFSTACWHCVYRPMWHCRHVPTSHLAPRKSSDLHFCVCVFISCRKFTTVGSCSARVPSSSLHLCPSIKKKHAKISYHMVWNGQLSKSQLHFIP